MTNIRKVKIFFLPCFLCLAVVGQSFAKLNFKHDFSAVSYSVDKSTDRSFYPDGKSFYLYETHVDFSNKTNSSGAESYGTVFLRSTDDMLVDTEKVSIEQFSRGYRDSKRDFLLGDMSAGLSNYSVSNSLKGMRFASKVFTNSKITVVGGVDTASWEQLWKEHEEGGPNKRYVGGARYQQALFKKEGQFIALNYGAVIDDKDSFATEDTYKKIHVVSGDIRYALYSELSFNAEYAQSAREAKTKTDAEYVDKTDSAYTVSVDYANPKFMTNVIYSEAGPYFETTGGFASQDLRTVQINNNIPLLSWFSCSPYYMQTRDNLEGDKETTTKNFNSGINFMFSLKGGLSLTSLYDLRHDKAEDDSSDSKTDTYTLGLAKTFGTISSGLNFSRSHVRDKVNDDQERDRDDLSLNLSGNTNIAKTNIVWTVAEILSVEKNIYDDDKDVLTAHSVGVNITFPKGFYLKANINIYANDYYKDENDSDINNYECTFSKDINTNVKAVIDYVQKNNAFTDESNDYVENKLVMKLAYNF